MPAIDLKDLPLEDSFATPEGKWAWKRGAVSGALDFLVANQRAVLFTQIWLLTARDTPKPCHTHVLPLGDGNMEIYEADLDDPWNAAKESWDTFCHRQADAVRRFIEATHAESRVTERIAPHLYYHLDFVSEQEYAEF